ncbi:MAG: hypothetical protein JSW48_05470 [Betaproteobacteria bacterium]|jgi:diketogulonate reductase-like aldo/keto reductase|nr:MAG: hypothetical protein JSW48_05470 [Betaproteobacteria bacterium]
MIDHPFGIGGLFTCAPGQALPPWSANLDRKSWAQFFLNYIVPHPAVTYTISAASKPKHLVDKMGAGFRRSPNEATRKRRRVLVDSFLN